MVRTSFKNTQPVCPGKCLVRFKPYRIASRLIIYEKPNLLKSREESHEFLDSRDAINVIQFFYQRRKIMHHKTLLLIAILVYSFLVSTFYCHASSVRQVTIDEMLQQCQFVFEGKVLSLEAEENSQKRIHTYVTFKIQNIIKGEYSSDTITLSFLGGTVGDVTMSVSDMKFPQVGERGIYFVESLERSQVNPLYGWSQGHFLVQPDDTGTDRVMTSSGQPVTGVLKDMPIEQMNSCQETLPLLSKGVAIDITFALKNNDNKGLTPEEFKKILRKKMGVDQ